MSKRQQIKERAKQERAAVVLAEQYAKTGDYEECARWYQAAAFHRAVCVALESE